MCRLIERTSGRRPWDYVAPWCEMSLSPPSCCQSTVSGMTTAKASTTSCLSIHGFGDTWTKIDYSQVASSWMKPLVRGHEIAVVEIGANWYLDDLPPIMFIEKSPKGHGFVNPRHIEEMWHDQFNCVHRFAPTSAAALRSCSCSNVSLSGLP